MDLSTDRPAIDPGARALVHPTIDLAAWGWDDHLAAAMPAASPVTPCPVA